MEGEPRGEIDTDGVSLRSIVTNRIDNAIHTRRLPRSCRRTVGAPRTSRTLSVRTTRPTCRWRISTDCSNASGAGTRTIGRHARRARAAAGAVLRAGTGGDLTGEPRWRSSGDDAAGAEALAGEPARLRVAVEHRRACVSNGGYRAPHFFGETHCPSGVSTSSLTLAAAPVTPNSSYLATCPLVIVSFSRRVIFVSQ